MKLQNYIITKVVNIKLIQIIQEIIEVNLKIRRQKKYNSETYQNSIRIKIYQSLIKIIL